MTYDFSRGEGRNLAAPFEIHPLRISIEESGGILVPGARRIDHGVEWQRIDDMVFVAG